MTEYKGKPAFFFQKAPQDTDPGWRKPCFPRIDYNIDMRYDPERKSSGLMVVNIWATSESVAMPEDIEKRVIELIDGTFYTPQGQPTVCALWNLSEAFNFEMPSTQGGNTSPEVFGISVTFDLLSFPEQLTTDPDPILGLNAWTKANFPDVTVIGYGEIPPLWKPTDKNPALYWRFESAASSDRQSFAVNWYTGEFAAHLIAVSVPERNRWTKALIELIQLWGEVVLLDGSPMLAKQIKIRHAADPLREGQLVLSGQYGVLASHRKLEAGLTVGNMQIANQSFGMEVTLHERNNEKSPGG